MQFRVHTTIPADSMFDLAKMVFESPDVPIRIEYDGEIPMPSRLKIQNRQQLQRFRDEVTEAMQSAFDTGNFDEMKAIVCDIMLADMVRWQQQHPQQGERMLVTSDEDYKAFNGVGELMPQLPKFSTMLGKGGISASFLRRAAQRIINPKITKIWEKVAAAIRSQPGFGT